MNYVSWGDAARFANWLTHNKPSGLQDASTTEDGAYRLNGATSGGDLAAVTRRADAVWALPSEDEWYKAAYHKNDGATANYWDYATAADELPSNVLAAPDPGNNANFEDTAYTLGAPYYRTPVGAFAASESAYGTFDQSGNVWEWDEAVLYSWARGLRGGSFFNPAHNLRSADRNYLGPDVEDHNVGLRVALVPEPGTLAPLGCGAALLAGRRRGRA